MQSLGIWTTDEELDLHPLYLIPKLHKCPYQPCSISKCSPRNMQTINMHSINDKQCAISYSRRGVNQLWILTKCNDIQARPPHAIILTYFPYSNLKQTKIINYMCFINNKWSTYRYKYRTTCICRYKYYLVTKLSETDIIKMF